MKIGPKSCDCLINIKSQINKSIKDSDLCLSSFTNQNYEGFLDLPPLKYTYKIKNKILTDYVGFKYCPFCGKKLEY